MGYLNSVVISVFVRNVIEIKVILICWKVLFVEYNFFLYKWMPLKSFMIKKTMIEKLLTDNVKNHEELMEILY